ncbi:polymer-forming cytoskeletal protein [Alicyclobacillus sp. ALC3]|uniref:polymer-forming cytoskeletal protein n=1 Tax=Alicyclobacillus sp. ALC3 TaxID=2796143 RepID=UPI00237912FA|nr:polymer-forming cytoskeletal protein [Alicyclobacillus sp. ALC3]WDL96090.1 polymer-forming cytoskeletal protein [Alicyclobacillus sp. ALC3]
MGEQRERPNLEIHGIGTASGGTYNLIRIHGKATIDGDVVCTRLDVHGVVSVSGDLEADHVHVHGQSEIAGRLISTEVQLNGGLNVGGDCSAESFRGHGVFQIDGLLNAEHIEVKIHGPSRAKEIGGQSIEIRGERRSPLGRWKKLRVDTVEGDDVRLESTQARVVRGNRVFVGRGCDVEGVEYRVDFQSTEGSAVHAEQKL